MMKQLLTEWHKHILNEVKPQIKPKVKPQVKTPQAPTPGKFSYTYSPKLISFLKSREAFKSSPYQKKGDRPTIGYGTTYYVKNGKEVAVTLDDKPVTEQQANQLMLDYLNQIVMPSLNRYLKDKPLTQNQIDALASVMYNMGNKGFLDTELFTVASLNPDDPKVKDLFLSDEVATVGGKVSLGLKKRRREELNMYLIPGSGNISKGTVTPPGEIKPISSASPQKSDPKEPEEDMLSRFLRKF
jgi:GH24 family phage-related lysozyme (muramidase)